jgi:hypothetical protein
MLREPPTKQMVEAARMVVALNEAGQQPATNLSLVRADLCRSVPLISKRTWQTVTGEIIRTKTGERVQARCRGRTAGG